MQTVCCGWSSYLWAGFLASDSHKDWRRSDGYREKGKDGEREGWRKGRREKGKEGDIRGVRVGGRTCYKSIMNLLCRKDIILCSRITPCIWNFSCWVDVSIVVAAHIGELQLQELLTLNQWASLTQSWYFLSSFCYSVGNRHTHRW